MAEHKLQSGYIDCLDKPYIFTYDGELLQLVPKDKESIRPYDFLEHKNIEIEILEGMTIEFDKIFFLNCHLNVSLSGYIAKPAGFICFNNGERTFNTVSFKSGIIDYFYRPNHIIDMENTKYDYNTGGGELKLKSFDETSKRCNIEIAGKKAILALDVTLPGEPLHMQVDYNLGKPKSILRLIFEEDVDVSEFRTIYMWVYNLMVFLNFRKSISLGKIELGNLNSRKKIERIAYTYLNEKDKDEISNVDAIIGYFFVFEHLNELLKILNNEELNLLFIPSSVKSDKYVSEEKYMICCTSFESVFNFAFPNAKIENNAKANAVKEEFLQFITDKREEYKGKDKQKREEFQKYAKIIELLDFSLAEKFKHCYDIYYDVIENYEKRIMYRLDITEEQLKSISTQFAEKRNMLVHSSLGKFEDIHILAYSLARVFIYVMILDKSGIQSEMIVQAIDKVL